jgi:hypothetical protein
MATFIDKETLQLMKDNDVWLSPQVTVYTFIPPGYTEGQAAKHRQAFAGIDQMFTAAKEIGFENIVFGSDIISSPDQILDDARRIRAAYKMVHQCRNPAAGDIERR